MEVMQPHHLIDVTFRPRLAGYLLASALMLAVAVSRQQSWLLAVSAFLPLYPWLLHALLVRHVNRRSGAWLSMHVDAVLVSLIAAALGFPLLTTAVLLTLLLASTLIVGGRQLLFRVMATGCMAFLITAVLRYRMVQSGTVTVNHDGAWADSLSDPVSVMILMVYMGIVAVLVHQETRLLNVSHRQEASSRQKLEGLGQRLRPFVAPQLFKLPEAEPARQRRRRLTVFFSDITGFTRLMDSLDESLVAELLGDYVETMNRIALGHGGTVDKFMGDGLMVFFGDPESRGAEADAISCLEMAVEMKHAVHRINRRWSGRIPGIELQIRMGIHSGYCLVGAFGGHERLEYTALGSTVNLASRLEHMADPGQILMSADTRKLVQRRAQVVDAGCHPVRGFRQSVQVYRLASMIPTAPGFQSLPGLKLLGRASRV